MIVYRYLPAGCYELRKFIKVSTLSIEERKARRSYLETRKLFCLEQRTLEAKMTWLLMFQNLKILIFF